MPVSSYRQAVAQRDRLARENTELRRRALEQQVRAQEAREAQGVRTAAPAAPSARPRAASPASAEPPPSYLASIPQGMSAPSGAIVDEDIHDPRNTRTTDTSGPEGILRVARTHRSAGRNQQAIDAYSRLVSDYPFSSRLPEAFLERGLVRLARGDRSGALTDFDTVAEAFPASPQAAEARRQGALLRRR